MACPPLRGRLHRRARAVALAAALAVTIACGAPERDAPPAADGPPPVLLLAVDGLEWDVLLPLLRAGELPTFERLLRRGAYGLLETTRPTLSPIIWTTIATGRPPSEHGIRGFTLGDPRTKRIDRLLNRHDRRAKAFWNVLSEHGRRVGVVGWWLTYPAPEVEGVVVAPVHTLGQMRSGSAIMKGSYVPEAAGQVFPAGRAAELGAVHAEVVEALPALLRGLFGGRLRSPHTAIQRFWRNSRWAFRADATYLRIGRRLARERPRYDVLAVYVGGTDVVGHRFWRFWEPGPFRPAPDPERVERLAGVIPAYYRYVDAQLGELIDAFGDGAAVWIVSDHGMHAFETDAPFRPDARKGGMSGHHQDAPPGVWVLSGPGVAPTAPDRDPRRLTRADLEPLGSVYDVLPTLLAACGLPVARDLAGEVLHGVLDVRPEAVAEVASYQDAAWRQRVSEADPDAVEMPSEQLRIQQLRALGYVP